MQIAVTGPRGSVGTSASARCALAAAIVVGALIGWTPAPASGEEAAARARFKAVVFDYLVLFNPDSIVPEAERLFPGRGRELTLLWRTRQFEYSWLRSLSGTYADFSEVTADALTYAAKALELPLTPESKKRLLDRWLRLSPWPDADNALQTLRRAGVRIATLTNLTPDMLRASADASGLTDRFDTFISTDENRTFKPDPRAYQLVLDRLQLKKNELLFVAFGAWDAAGAKAFGYPTYWVNRSKQPFEELGQSVDGTSVDLRSLVEFVIGHEQGDVTLAGARFMSRRADAASGPRRTPTASK